MPQFFVSMAIGLILIAATLQCYQMVYPLKKKEAKASHLRAVRRVFVQHVMEDIQASGYKGSRSSDPNFPLRFSFENEKTEKLKGGKTVWGFKAIEGVCQQRLSKGACQRVKANSDVLLIYQIPRQTGLLKIDMKNAYDKLILDQEMDVLEGSVMLVSDWLSGDMFRVSDVQGDALFHSRTVYGNLTQSLSKPYRTGARVTELQNVAYYLAIPTRGTGLNTGYSLYREEERRGAEELLEGIKHFKVCYGRRNSKGLFYQEAAFLKEADWAEVQTIKITLETQAGEKLEYESRLRNRYHFNCNAYSNNGTLFGQHSADELRHFKR